MKKTFKGRIILSGEIKGEAVVTRTGLNTLASFYQSILKNESKAVCSDHNNPELYKKILSDKIICLPKTVGSTSAGAVLDRIACMGIAPKAFLFSEPIDSLAAAGVVLADIWAGRRIITIDQLGSEFLEKVNTGQTVEIREDGTVLIDE